MVADEGLHSKKRKGDGSSKNRLLDKGPRGKRQKSHGDNANAEAKSSTALKREMKKERQSHRRHAGSVVEAKHLWNKLRLKTNTEEETRTLMKEVMVLVREKVSEIALQHDASRVVQAAIQFGNTEQKKEVLRELCDNSKSLGGLPELSKIQYAHFCTLKLLKYCNRDEECMQMIVKSLKGSIPKLAVHSVGAKVVESLFLNCSAKYTNSLKQEFYGPHFSLFAPGDNMNKKGSKASVGVPSLQSNLSLPTTTQAQRESAISFLKEIVFKGMAKSFFGYSYFQELLAEYLDVIPEDEKQTMIGSIVDHSLHLLSTRHGTAVAAICASYGTPKDRKRMMKALKGYVRQTLLHKDAYLALLRLVEVTDDTVSTSKTIFSELLTDKGTSGASSIQDARTVSPLLELALDETASKLFLMLLVDDDTARLKYFDPYERSLLYPEQVPMIDGVPTSKKNPTKRRHELLKGFKQALVDLCSKHSNDLIRSLPGSRVLKELYACTSGKEVQTLVESVMEVCMSAWEQMKESDANNQKDIDEFSERELCLFEHPLGHRAIKSIILCDAKKEDAFFSKAFLKKFGDGLLDVAKSSRGAFVVAALFQVPTLREDVMKRLKPKQDELAGLSKLSGQATAGYMALIREMTKVA